MKTTNIMAVKDATKTLLCVVPVEVGQYGVVSHPFTLTSTVVGKEMKFYDLLNFDEYRHWIKEMFVLIDGMPLPMIYSMVNTAWKMTWLKFVGDALGEEDFAEYLAMAWVDEENPNMDANVSRKKAVSWFRNANKRFLMSDDDFSYWEKLPSKLTVYRGVARGRIEKGLSWTDSRDKAEWFQNRFNRYGEGGYLLKAEVGKGDVLCYFNTRSEQETVINVFSKTVHIERV